jgi:hypothetical protein
LSWSWTLIVALTMAGAACGKKGPPLTPFVRVPAAVESLTPRRLGDEVYVSFTVPAQNIDQSQPASIARIEVYAATALAPPTRARFLEIATRIGTVPVAPAADPGNPGAIMPAPDPKAGAIQGAAVTVREILTADAMRPRELPVLASERRAAPTPVPAPVSTAAPRVPVPRRFYMAIAFTAGGTPGPPSPVVEMPLTNLPEPPAGVQATMSAAAVMVSWEPSGGLLGWLMDQAIPVEPPPFAEPIAPRTTVQPITSDLPPGPTRYNVYRELSPDPLALPAAPAAAMLWNAAAPPPLNALPLAVLAYLDPVVLDERERCYSVRALRGAVESQPTARACVTAHDIYPPAAPIRLQAVPGEGQITLIWEPNIEDDLGGYIVLRAEAGGDTLLQLTAQPISTVRYVDRSVTPGVQYTYVVRAVDRRVPIPNQSAPAEVIETAR